MKVAGHKTILYICISLVPCKIRFHQLLVYTQLVRQLKLLDCGIRHHNSKEEISPHALRTYFDYVSIELYDVQR